MAESSQGSGDSWEVCDDGAVAVGVLWYIREDTDERGLPTSRDPSEYISSYDKFPRSFGEAANSQ